MSPTAHAIEFKDHTLFDTFELDPSTSASELMKAFQTKPEHRKHLPAYIKTLKDKEELYLEALMCSRAEGTAVTFASTLEIPYFDKNILSLKRKVAIANDIARNLDDYTDDSASTLEIAASIISDVIDSNLAAVSPLSAADLYGTIANSYKDTLIKAISEKIGTTINALDGKKSLKLFVAFCNPDLSVRMITKFRKNISDKTAAALESIPARIEKDDFLKRSLQFIEDIEPLMEIDEIYPSFKFCCNKLTASISDKQEILLPHISTLVSLLKDKDTEAVSHSIQSFCYDLASPENTEVGCSYQEIHKATTAITPIRKTIESNLDADSSWTIGLVYALDGLGQAKYLEFNTFLNMAIQRSNLNDTLFRLCSFVFNDKGLREYKVFYCNVLSKATGFIGETQAMLDRIEVYNNAIEQAKRVMPRESHNPYNLWRLLIQSVVNDNTILTVQNIEAYIGNYYALSILDENLCDNFKAIIQIYLNNIVVLADSLPDRNPYGYYDRLNPKGRFIRDFLQSVPENWIIGTGKDAHSVCLLCKQMEFTSSGIISDAPGFMAKCDQERTQQEPARASGQSPASRNTQTGVNQSEATQTTIGDQISMAIFIIRRYLGALTPTIGDQISMAIFIISASLLILFAILVLLFQ